MNKELLNILNRLSILCVEDEKGVRKRLGNTLKFYFKTVLEASNGSELLRYTKRRYRYSYI